MLRFIFVLLRQLIIVEHVQKILNTGLFRMNLNHGVGF